jgi:hypothetical protein
VPGTCRLCGEERDLQESHRIPRFVFRWLRETSPTGMRHSKNPNVRVQDGWKCHYLCRGCENRFSQWEAEFARHVFRPYHDRARDPLEALHYGDWCLPFCVSVSWRTLSYCVETGIEKHMSMEQKALVQEALGTWRGYLLGLRTDPGAFEQHLFPVDTLKSGPRKLMNPFLNRYLLRAVQESVILGSESLLTYAKLGRIMLFGFVRAPRELLGWKIRVRKGYIAPKGMRMPYWILDYILEQANRCAGMIASMSDKQKALARSGAERSALENMESWRAIQADVMHSGHDAFAITRNAPSKEAARPPNPPPEADRRRRSR